MEFSVQASEQILVSAHTNTKNNVFILSQTETLFLLVNFSVDISTKEPCEPPQLWVLTLDHIPIWLNKHIYILPQISSLKNALEQTNTTQIAHQKEGENKPIHSIVRKECIQILELFSCQNLWFWHLPLCQVPCWECEGPSALGCLWRASWSQEQRSAKTLFFVDVVNALNASRPWH